MPKLGYNHIQPNIRRADSMWKLIFLALIIWLGIYLFKRIIKETRSQHTEASQARDTKAEDMVQCATCNVHLPRSEAFLVNDSFYCSKAHIPNK